MSHRCTLPPPHGRRNYKGGCLECRRLNNKRYRMKGRDDKFYAIRITKLSRIINQALRSWRLPYEPRRVLAPHTNPGQFAPSDPRASVIGRMGARVSPWRFGIHWSKPE